MSSLTRVARVRNPQHERSGVKAYAHLMNKYKFQPTKDGPFFIRQVDVPVHPVRKHLERLCIPFLSKKIAASRKTKPVLAKQDADGNVTHIGADDIQHDSEYLVPVTIGTPGQVFNLDFDTGSSDLWVFSTQLPAKTRKAASAAQHTLFDAKKSSTFKKASDTWKISYGDGSSASGSTGTDVVRIGSVSVSGQVVELAKVLSAEFAQGAGDGLLGLAWPAINTVSPRQAATPVENMIGQGLLAQGIFTAHLASWRQDKSASSSSPPSSGAAEGETMYDGDSGKFVGKAAAAADDGADVEGSSFYTFGGLDADVLAANKATASDIYYTPVDSSQGFWQFASGTASVNGQTVQRATASNSAIADTGTTLALVDDALVEAVYAAVPGAVYDWRSQGYVFPAATPLDGLPEVRVAVGDRLFALPREALAYADAGDGMVYGGVQSRGSLPFDILGDVFLKGVYAVFDQQNERFGVLQRADPTDNMATAADEA